MIAIKESVGAVGRGQTSVMFRDGSRNSFITLSLDD